MLAPRLALCYGVTPFNPLKRSAPRLALNVVCQNRKNTPLDCSFYYVIGDAFNQNPEIKDQDQQATKLIDYHKISLCVLNIRQDGVFIR